MFTPRLAQFSTTFSTPSFTQLLPAGEVGAIQKTESFVGPYETQDFTLFYVTRFGFLPSKIAYLAWNAWHDPTKGAWPANTPDKARRAFDLPEIKRWMRVFLTRFFGQNSSSARRCRTDRRFLPAARCAA